MPLGPVVLNGNVSLLTPRQQLALLGKSFVATNPTAGTAIAYAQQTSFSATANGLFAIQNTDAPGGTNIVLDYLKLKQTATAPTGTLNMNFEVFAETGLVTLTGNVASRTPVNPNLAYTVPSTVSVQSFAAGAATVPAAVGTRRFVTMGWIPTGVTVAQDSYVLTFGGENIGGTAGLTAARATAPAAVAGQAGAVVIAPQTTAWINMWWVTGATNVASFEFELGGFVI